MIILINNFNKKEKDVYKKNIIKKNHYLHYDDNKKLWLAITDELKVFSFVNLTEALQFIKLLQGANL